MEVPGGQQASGHRFRRVDLADGLERMDARIVGEGFSPHRHETYAVGVTRFGVQAFGYRGSRRACLPGQWHVLHPDEPHDGMPGTGDGFGYRILYVDPALVRESLGGLALPFVADPVVDARRVPRVLVDVLADEDTPPDGFRHVEVVAAVAAMLAREGGTRRVPLGPLHEAAVRRVRDAIRDEPARLYRAEDLEVIAGLDRWTLARHFRAAYGTSPSRFRTAQQLQVARRLVLDGRPLAEAAALAGFADQAHLTRMFKRAYGITPAAWRAATSGS
ncbi:AraC family transcriptional regulator [Aeromicrobium phragmitis]|uniref:AraC family transcriptional regulator n=1 Tax=Aeromicrobium phragmitis TaxID=2478914 RepID=A0A3L8PQM5_9ACTN|nr:AraC family transcriptional regulator [Aeromicrobium phragmitis]RLV57494.1 AraC family transcriptional regulator [Aeromicrobium phragmitis]